MGILQRLSKVFSSRPQEAAEGIWIRVECAECGEEIRSRIDPKFDLTPIYGDKGVTGYYVRKVLIGSSGRCFNPIEVKLTFDTARHLVEKDISGGRFIDVQAQG